jgi:hypothetical protein
MGKGLFKHLLWIAPVAGVLVLIIMHMQDVQTYRVERDSASYEQRIDEHFAMTADDPAEKAKYKARAEESGKVAKDMQARADEAQGRVDRLQEKFAEAMKEVDDEMSGKAAPVRELTVIRKTKKEAR